MLIRIVCILCRKADDEQQARQSDDYDQLEVPFLKEMHKSGKKDQKSDKRQVRTVPI